MSNKLSPKNDEPKRRGRPPVLGLIKRVHVSVCLPPEMIKALRELGCGNLSAGVVHAATEYFRFELKKQDF